MCGQVHTEEIILSILVRDGVFLYKYEYPRRAGHTKGPGPWVRTIHSPLLAAPLSLPIALELMVIYPLLAECHIQNLSGGMPRNSHATYLSC